MYDANVSQSRKRLLIRSVRIQVPISKELDWREPQLWEKMREHILQTARNSIAEKYPRRVPGPMEIVSTEERVLQTNRDFIEGREPIRVVLADVSYTFE